MHRRAESALLLLAVALRLVHFLGRGALWGDESALAMNISPKSIAELGNPYVYTQICPWGYLLFTKLSTLACGDSERTLRSFSFLSGLTIPPLTALAAQKMLDRRAGLIALALSAISPFLIYFSAELKPYATDAAVTAAVLALVALIVSSNSKRAEVGLFAFGAIAVWFSLSAIFVLGGACVALAVAELENRRSVRRFLTIGTFGLVWCASFYLHLRCFLSQSSAASSQQVSTFWSGGFMPFPPRSLDDLLWTPAKFFYSFVEPGGFGMRYLAGALFLLGGYAIAKRSRAFAALLFTPLVLLLLASALGRYPILERLLLFVVPILIIGVSASVALLFERKAALGRIGLLLVALISIRSVTKTAEFSIPPPGPDIADFAERLAREVRSEDGIYLDDSVQWTWLYYGFKHPLPIRHVDTSRIPPDDFFEIGKPQAYLQQLAPLFGKKRVYVILSDFAKPGRGATFDRYYTEWFDSHGGRRIEEVRGRGLLFVVYDLSEARP